MHELGSSLMFIGIAALIMLLGKSGRSKPFGENESGALPKEFIYEAQPERIEHPARKEKTRIKVLHESETNGPMGGFPHELAGAIVGGILTSTTFAFNMKSVPILVAGLGERPLGEFFQALLLGALAGWLWVYSDRVRQIGISNQVDHSKASDAIER